MFEPGLTESYDEESVVSLAVNLAQKELIMKQKKSDPIFCIHQSNYDAITTSNLESRGVVIISSIESKLVISLSLTYPTASLSNLQQLQS